MANIIQNGPVSIYQDIELSLTEHLVPPVVHVKQFDHKARKVRCTLYANAIEYTIPANIILAYSGTRPDGRIFQYSTEALNNDKVDLIDNRLVITITDFMTEVAGRYPVDLVMLDVDGDILGSFSFTLYVERAAAKNRKILTATYASVAEAVRNGVFECFTTEDEITRDHYDIKSIKLVRFIYKKCGWEKKLTYRIPGEKYAPDSGLVVFDLRKAYEIHEGRMREAK